MIWLKRIAVTAAVFVAGLLALDQIFPPPLERGAALSAMVSDRTGKPLRAFPTKEGRWRFQANLDDIDPVFIEALLQVEDKRFYQHGGVDFIGVLRAAGSNISSGEVVSGASTITMQTARLLEPRPRTLGSKFIEMLRAWQIERRLSKREILEMYLTLAPYGGNLEGVRAASWRYFGREPDRLSDDQIALLIALPQSPEMRRPDRRPKGAMAGREIIAKKLHRHGWLDDRRLAETLSAPLPGRHTFPDRAWQVSAKARSAANGKDAQSSIDASLQNDLQALAKQHAETLGPDVQVSMMVVDVPTRGVRASIGSASRQRAGGWLDLTAQARSPGSTLKPFIYAMAFDDGIAAPNTTIADLPKRFSNYRPENFDRSFRGDVSIREALQHSLNVPAVLTLDRVGPERFAAQLALSGAAPRIYGTAKTEPGLTLALGGAGMTAREIVMLYAALGDGGRAKPLVWLADDEELNLQRSGRRLVSPDAAAKVLEILRSAPTPEGRIPGRLTENAPQIAFKTGTSYGYRDAWAAGVAGDLAFVVWVGRADGTPRPGKTGRNTALPILFDVADRAALRLGGQDGSGERLVSPVIDQTSTSLASFSDESPPPEILFPPIGAELWGGTVNGEPARPFVFAGRGDGELSWFVDGTPCETDAAGAPVWQPDQPGFYRIKAVDKFGRSADVRVRVLGAGG